MKEIPQISDAEWQVMKVLWEQQHLTANEVIEKLEPVSDWSPKTIRTLLTRLVKKGALDYKEKNRLYHYYPLISEDECVKAESTSFIQKVYGGSLNLMIANFIKERKLSDKEIEELKNILDDK